MKWNYLMLTIKNNHAKYFLCHQNYLKKLESMLYIWFYQQADVTNLFYHRIYVNSINLRISDLIYQTWIGS